MNRLVRVARIARVLVSVTVLKLPPSAKDIAALGPVCIKLGQMVASRRDIVGVDVSERLRPLTDRVADVVPPEEAKLVLQPLVERGIIESYEEAPIAAASIGQVHRGVLKGSKRQVAIKIKRPGVDEQITSDVRALWDILLAAQRFFDLARLEMPKDIDRYGDILRGVAKALSDELDFAQEARNMQKYREQLKKSDAGVTCPKIYAFNDDAIVMEFIQGKSLSALENPRPYAVKIMSHFARMILGSSMGVSSPIVIHADPHAGNILVEPTGRIVLLDFGNVMTLSSTDVLQLKQALAYLLENNQQGMLEALGEVGCTFPSGATDAWDYMQQYKAYAETLKFEKLKPQDPGKVPMIVNGVALKLVRIMTILDGVCLQLDDKFNYAELFKDVELLAGLIADEGLLELRVKMATNKFLEEIGFGESALATWFDSES